MKNCLPILFLVFFCSGCHKEGVDLKEYPELVGDYDWTYSLMSMKTIYSLENTDYQFGIRLKKNGRVFLYEHGKLVGEGYVYKVSKNPLEIRVGGSSHFFSVSKDGLVSTGYPFNAISNNFQKK